MKQMSLSRALLLAGVVAAAGVAQAQTYDVPQQAGEASTMTHGAPNLLTDNQHNPAVMGAAPAPYVSYTPDTVVTHVHRPQVVSRTSSAATFNVPSRAGEASTMTGGAPNMVTDNWRVINQANHPVVVVN